MFQDTTDQDATDSTPECGFFFFNLKNKEATIVTKKGAVHDHLRFLFVEEIYFAYR